MKQLIVIITVLILFPLITHSQEIVFQKEYNHNERVQCQKVSSNSNFLLVGTTSRIDLVDLNTLETIFEANIGDVISVDISVDELRLLALTEEKIIYEWDLNSKLLIRQIDYFKNKDSITGIKKAIYNPVDNRICVGAYYEHLNIYKSFLFLYSNDENVIETGYKALDLFDFTSDGKYFVDPGILSVITSSERFPNLVQDLKQSDIIETFKYYDPFDKPRAISLDISSNNKYALITSDQNDISVLEIQTKNLYTNKDIGKVNNLNIIVSSIDNTGNYLLSSTGFEQYLSITDLRTNLKLQEFKNVLIGGILNYIDSRDLLIVNHFYDLYLYSFDLDAITSIQDEEQNSTFNIYPSPSNETVNLQFDSNISGNFNSKLLDLNSAVLIEYPMNYVQIGNNQFTFSTSNFPPGEYFLVTEGIINESFPIVIGGD